MKLIVSIIVFMLISANNVQADYLEDMKNFGYVAGGGIACDAPRYKAYSLVTQAYLVSAARSDEEQEKGMIAYNEGKAHAYLLTKSRNLMDCGEIRERFERQKIFKTKLFKNGILKMPDGKVIRPRKPYDVTNIYDRNSNEKEYLDKIYEENIRKKKQRMLKEGIYEKIKQEELKARNRY